MRVQNVIQQVVGITYHTLVAAPQHNMKRSFFFHTLLALYGTEKLEQIKAAGNIVLDSVEIEQSELDKIVPGWKTTKPKHPQPPPPGLGDFVYWCLHPFVLVLDRFCGTRLEGCQSCAERRARLNRWWHKGAGWLRVRLNSVTHRIRKSPTSLAGPAALK